MAWGRGVIPNLTPGFVQTTVLAKYAANAWPGDFLTKARSVRNNTAGNTTVSF